MATATIKAKVNGVRYTACFYNESYEQIKMVKANEAIDVEDFSDDGWWSIIFPYKSRAGLVDWSLVLIFKVDQDGTRTNMPLKVQVLNEQGVINSEYDTRYVTIK